MPSAPANILRSVTNLLGQSGRRDSSEAFSHEPAHGKNGPVRLWIDVGAHLGEKTYSEAQSDPLLTVYAFEPNLAVARQIWGTLENYVVVPAAVSEQDGFLPFNICELDAASSLLQYNADGLQNWIGNDGLQKTQTALVPTIRLDTFMESLDIEHVDYLKIDAQGADLAVIKSAGERLSDIDRITLEVQVTNTPLYEGAASKNEVTEYLRIKGYNLISTESQTHGQEENLTFAKSGREIPRTPE
jgi:FkbM family methyltransferase